MAALVSAESFIKNFVRAINNNKPKGIVSIIYKFNFDIKKIQ